jgi:hypothetical protein
MYCLQYCQHLTANNPTHKLETPRSKHSNHSTHHSNPDTTNTTIDCLCHTRYKQAVPADVGTTETTYKTTSRSTQQRPGLCVRRGCHTPPQAATEPPCMLPLKQSCVNSASCHLHTDPSLKTQIPLYL